MRNHGRSCMQRTLDAETEYFTGNTYHYLDGSLQLTTLSLGSVTRGYPKKKDRGHCFFFNQGCSPSLPWIAVPWLPRGGEKIDHLGPFKTKQEALEALEEFWLKRLGVKF